MKSLKIIVVITVIILVAIAFIVAYIYSDNKNFERGVQCSTIGENYISNLEKQENARFTATIQQFTYSEESRTCIGYYYYSYLGYRPPYEPDGISVIVDLLSGHILSRQTERFDPITLKKEYSTDKNFNDLLEKYFPADEK